MKRIAIVGGGIAGLTAAYTLEKQRATDAPLEYVLYERTSRLGGVLVTERVEDCLVEAGPDSFLTEKPWALTLCRELGLGDQVIGSNDAQRKTFILVKGRLVEMPDGIMFLVPTKLLPTAFSPLFSWGTKLRMALELIHPPRRKEGDESVASFIERHFGAEMVDRLADPLLSGVYGADSASLSAHATMLRFVEMEAKYGSLCRGMLAARKRMATMMRGRPAPPLFSSLKDGMQQLVDTLLTRVDPGALRTSREVREVRQTGEKWEIFGDSWQERFDGVVLATPAHIMGTLLESTHPRLAAELGGVSYSSSVTITMIYDRGDMKGRDNGFGFLVPRSENRRMRACTFVHNKFPHRAPENRAIVRTFLGGLHDEAVLAMSDDEIVSLVRHDLRDIVGITAAPRAVRLYRWNRAMAQPSPGHLQRLERIENHLRQLPGLGLAGNAFRGIGVPDCVRTGQHAAERAAGLRTEQMAHTGPAL